MAGFYSFGRIKIISRNGARSSVATAAYHAAIKITNEYDGVTHDHTRKKNVGDTFIRMPESVPDRWRDESIPAKERLGEIWNAIEQAHPADNARLARSNYIALPHNLTLEQGLECVDRFIKENCTDKGMGATYSTHLMPGNHHVDVMYFVSEYDKKGKPKEKSKKEYLCRDKNGNERYMDADTFKSSEGYEKVYKYQKDGERADMTPSEASGRDGWERINKYPVCRTVKVSGWDDKDLAKKWRKSWEIILNEKYEELGMKDRVDCRSYKEQGISKLATIHEGWGTDKEERQAYNLQIKDFNKELGELYHEGMGAIRSIEGQIIDLQDNKQTVESVEKHETDYEVNEYKLNAIIESELFSQRITRKFKAKLDELSKWMNKWLALYREKIKELYGANTRVTEPSKPTQQAAEKVKRSFEDIVVEAKKIQSEKRSCAPKKKTKEPER